ncbi:MAG TPA: leucyl aminopeptidase [Jatrophihabitantaceae bacterium]|jgi:leucyl aminopeptidase
MPSVSLVDAATLDKDAAVVVGVHSGPDGPEPEAGSAPVDAALGGRLAAALAAVGATGKADEVVKIATLGLAPFPVVVATGLGDRNGGLDPEQVRRGVGAALRALSTSARAHIAIGDAATAGAATEGALLGAYTYTEYKSKPTPPALRRLTIGVADARDRATRAAIRRAQVVAEAVAFTRNLVNVPPNHLYPGVLASHAAEAGREAGLEVELLDEKALRRQGYGGILGVGSGSARPPRLVRLRYRPPRPRARVALVGKGITFDSGGLNLKPGSGLVGMKSDMGGAAAVLSSIVAAAKLKLPVEVVATLPMAENMISGSSYRPSDVLTLRGGTTLEITDTDAEGRVILADAIVRAGEDDPDYLLEISTLTGGQVVALGTRVIGAMGEPAFRDRVVAAGNAAGEAIWAMPLPDELRAGLDSPVADIANLPDDRWGSMLVGGRFLAEFMPEGVPWVHMDIAGPSFNSGAAHDYTPKGGTGAGTRTLIAMIDEIASA